MGNPFDKFKTETKKVKVKALGNTEVTIRSLTVAENDLLGTKVIKDVDNGKVTLDYGAMAEAKVEKVSYALVEPKMTIEELKALPVSASGAIDEIFQAIEEFNSPKV